MPGEELNTTLRFDADISDFSAAMQEARRAASLAKSEFAAVSSGMEDWESSTEGLTAKLKQLSAQQQVEERKLAILRDAYEKVVEEQGENSKAAVDLKTKINNQIAAVNKAASQHDKFAEKLEEVEREADGAEKSVESAGKAAKKSGKDAEDGSDGWSIMKDVVADLVSNAIQGLIDSIISAAEATREYRREIAKMSTNASAFGHDMTKVKRIMSEVSASTGDTGAAMEGLNMLMAAGFDTNQISYAADALSGAAMKFDGLNFEGMAEGLQETLATGKAVGPFAELIERLGYNLEDFDEGLAACTTEAERQQYAMDFLAKSGLKGVHDAYVRNNADLVEAEKAQFRHNEAMAAMGAALEPFQTAITNATSSIIEGLVPSLEWIGDNMGWITPIIAGAATAIGIFAAALAIVPLINAVKTAFAALSAVIMANPFVAVAAAVAGLTVAIVGLIKNGGQRFVEAAKEWAASVSPFSHAITAAKANTIDFEKALSSTGKTMDQLQTDINEAETAITTILSTAMEEQRALRADEILQIENYNQRIRELEAEKMAIYGDQMQAEITMIEHRQTLTQEDAAQTLANQREYLEQADAAARKHYQNELIMIQNKHKANGTLNSEAYTNEVKAAQAHYDEQLEKNKSYYTKTVNLVMEKSNQWVKQDAKKWDELNNYTGKSKKEYAKMLDSLDADNANAFLSMYLETKRSGGYISAETEELARDMLGSFDDLPKGLQGQGKEALLGLISGMEDKIPALSNASEMTADEIIDTLSGELEIHSPSKVTRRMGNYITEGLGNGMTEKESWLQRTTSGFLGRTMDFFKNILGIHSPSKETAWMGEMLVAGLVGALNDGRKDVQAAFEGLTDGMLDVPDVGGTFSANGVSRAGKTINFYQTNNSPKAQSPAEIYRLTHNALSYVGGM